MTRFSEDVTPFRFSPTSFLSETSMSFQDYEDEHGKIGDMAKGASSCLKVASSVSSVSSVTLQGEDTLSLGYDTTSLPEDPFPEGLPSSASSTIGTPASSRSSISDFDVAGEDASDSEQPTEELLHHEDAPSVAACPIANTGDKMSRSPTSSGTTPIISESADHDLNHQIGSDKKEENFPEETEEINEEEVEEALELVTETCQKNSSDNEEENQEENIDDNDEMLPNLVVDGQEIPDIFNHRSSSRMILRCKSQPSGGSSEAPPSVWKANEQWRKSLSPSFLKSGSEDLEANPEISSQRSIFSPSSFLTLYLPGHGNKPLDPMAVSAVHRTLVDTPAPILAVHLTRVDLWVFGILRKNILEESVPKHVKKRHPLYKLTDPMDKSFQNDLLDRYLCLRTMVVISILAASNLVESCRVLSKWIRIADETGQRLKNFYGFHCLASGLLGCPHLMSWNPLWSELKESHPMEWSLLNGPIRDLMHNCLAGEAASKPEATVPDVLPLIAEVSWCWDKEDCSSGLAKGKGDEEYLSSCAALTDVFTKNAQITFRQLRCTDDILLDLFRTEFHVRLLWGSKGVRSYPQNFSERHAKFAKVLTALSAICARQI